jgi:hypothetical protein
MFILDLDLNCWLTKRVNISNEYLRIISFFVVVNNLLYSLFCKNILVVVCLDKNIPNIFVLDRDLCNLNFSSTVILQPSDGLPTLPNNESNCVIWHRYDVSIGRRGSIRCHHAFVQRLVRKTMLDLLLLGRVIKLLSYN